MSRVLFGFVTLFATLNGFAAPLRIPAKTWKPVSPSARWAAAIQNMAKGHHKGNSKGPSHPVPPGHQDNSSLAHWTGSFTTAGTKYNFTMVGTDPSKGSATTIVDAAVIPFKLVFADNSVFDASSDMIDGRTPLNGAVQSPVFQNATYLAGGTNLGNTQFGDAVQRANFWSTVSTKAPGYHVLLSTPHVMPTQIVQVPADLGQTFVDSSTGRKVGVVDLVWLDNLLINTGVNLGIGPSTLAIHQFGEVIAVGLNGYGALGYHNAIDMTGKHPNAQGAVTYIFSSWFTNAAFGNEVGIGNTGTLGHEIAEWMDDPYADNIVPFWQDPAIPHVCAQDFLEVGDPLESLMYFTVTTGGFGYTLPDVALLPWFSRQAPSTAVNGYYTFRNQLPTFSQACPLFTDYDVTTVDVPNAAAVATVLTGVNNHQTAVGYWNDAGGGAHGFFFDGKKFTPINIPGAISVQPLKLNDKEQVVGYYSDSSNSQHGFLWQKGNVRTVDFPGAEATILTSLDNGATPKLVGSYLIGTIVSSFVISGGQFLPVTVSGFPSVFANGINDSGILAGAAGDSNSVPLVAFLGPLGHTQPLVAQSEFGPGVQTIANSLNNPSQMVGSFFDGFVTHGFLAFQGLWTNIDLGNDFDGAFSTEVMDNNDQGTIVGTFSDLNGTGIHGYLATPVK